MPLSYSLKPSVETIGASIKRLQLPPTASIFKPFNGQAKGVINLRPEKFKLVARGAIITFTEGKNKKHFRVYYRSSKNYKLFVREV